MKHPALDNTTLNLIEDWGLPSTLESLAYACEFLSIKADDDPDRQIYLAKAKALLMQAADKIYEMGTF